MAADQRLLYLGRRQLAALTDARDGLGSIRAVVMIAPRVRRHRVRLPTAWSVRPARIALAEDVFRGVPLVTFLSRMSERPREARRCTAKASHE